MNAMTCEQVQKQLDLLAAGACDGATRQTLERHLEACRACAAGYAASQRLLGLLDLHLNPAGVDRLRRRIDTEARRPRRGWFVNVVRGAVAAAALVLIVA